MKSIKRFLLLILALTMLVMSFALTSCGDDGDDGDGGSGSSDSGSGNGGSGNGGGSSACQHTYGAWTVTTAPACTTAGVETRTCTKCQAPETRTVVALGHDGDLVCEVCYETVFNVPTVDFSEYKSIGLELKDYTLTLVYKENYDSVYDSTMTIDVLSGYVGLDDNGELVGAGKGTIRNVGANTNLDNSMELTFVIENGVLYAGMEGDNFEVNTTYGENQYVKIDLTAETAPELEEMEEILAQVEALVPVIEEWYNEEFAPIFADVSISTDGAKKYAAKLANALLKKTVATDGSYTLTIDFEAIKAFNSDLATKKISQIVDVLLGEGTYADVKAFINSDEFYSFSVADVIDYIETEQGVDLAELFGAINSLLATLTDNEDMTLEALLIQSGEFEGMIDEDFDIVEFLRSEEMANFSVMAALKTFIPAEDDPTTADVDEAAAAVKEFVAGIFTQLESTTVYELLAMMGGSNNEQVRPNPDDEDALPNPGAGNAPVADEDPMAAIVAEINAMIDMISEMTGITINVDKNGNYVSTVISVTVSDPSLTLTADITVTATDVTVDMALEGDMGDVQNDAECTVKVVPGMTVTVEAAKVAALKAVFADIPTVNNQEFFNIAKNYIDDSLYNDYFYYTEGNTLYAICVEGINLDTDNDVARIYVSIYKTSNVYNAMTVMKGCTNKLYVTLEAPFEMAEGSFDAQNISGIMAQNNYNGECDFDFINTYYLNAGNAVANVQSLIDSADKNDAWQEDYANLSFLFDTATDTLTPYYNNEGYMSNSDEIDYNGHHFVLDETKSTEPEDYCTDMGKRHYKCSTCDYEYDYYYINGHSLGGSFYMLNDTAAGLAGGFKMAALCMNTGCGEVVTEDYTIYVDADASLNARYQAAGVTGATFLITVTEAGEYTFYTDAPTDETCDTRLGIWNWDTANSTMRDAVDNSIDDDVNNMHESTTLNLAAGTYLVAVWNGTVRTDSYTLHVEAAN